MRKPLLTVVDVAVVAPSPSICGGGVDDAYVNNKSWHRANELDSTCGRRRRRKSTMVAAGVCGDDDGGAQSSNNNACTAQQCDDRRTQHVRIRIHICERVYCVSSSRSRARVLQTNPHARNQHAANTSTTHKITAVHYYARRTKHASMGIMG